MFVGIDPKVDYAFKWLFGREGSSAVLIDLLQAVLLPKFGKPVGELSTALDGWLYFLRRAEELDPAELPRSLDKPEIRQALEALTMLAHTDMQREVYEGRLKAIRDERARMDDAESRGLEKGLERGLEKGLEKGLERGREEGALIGRIQLLEQLLGQPETPGDALVSRTTEELQRMVDELRQRLGR